MLKIGYLWIVVQVITNRVIITAYCRLSITRSRLSSQTTGGGHVVRWCWVNFQYRVVLLIWIRVGQGPTALAVGAAGGCLDIFISSSFLFSFSLSLGDDPI